MLLLRHVVRVTHASGLVACAAENHEQKVALSCGIKEKNSSGIIVPWQSSDRFTRFGLVAAEACILEPMATVLQNFQVGTHQLMKIC